ncbi:ANR family transcriptional regulator [Escherichia coli]|nr:ANR family transcriptional regulator [Escherichia coli]
MIDKKRLIFPSRYFSQALLAVSLEQRKQYQEAMEAWYLAMEYSAKPENIQWCRVRAERCKRMAFPS